ncbi:hypothetical protein MG293_007810 [Ovis ammon polii]|uniref:Uncharacterized protein n=1 Tax=Ovis ammon polii TaxID=230172 RepID=A0AAD4UC91_OVIAM|nr:hypothetical protein MG293_007810 [Ovis ammon polii]
MKRKSERRPNWAAAPPCSRRCSSSSPGVKKSRSSTSQELHHLDQQDDLYLDITAFHGYCSNKGIQIIDYTLQFFDDFKTVDLTC